MEVVMDVLSMTADQIRKAMCRDICIQFVENQVRTSRRELRKYRNTDVIRSLCDSSCIDQLWDTPNERQSYIPRLGAFLVAEDESQLQFVKSGMVLVVRVLQDLYDEGPYDPNLGFSSEQVFRRAKQIDATVSERALQLGLFFRPGTLGGYRKNEEQTAITSAFVNDLIGDIHNPKQWVEEHIEQCRPRNDDRCRYELQLHAAAPYSSERVSVPDLDGVIPTTDDPTFEKLAKSVKEAIDSGAPEVGLDRLHTFTVKFLRALCLKSGISSERTTPINGLMGAYVKSLRQRGLIESEMAERILTSSISVLEAFNKVRNNMSFAHDNQLLGSPEALLICTHVCASIRFILEWERGLTIPDEPNDLPF